MTATTVLTTEIGLLEVTATDGGHVHVCSRPLNVEPLVINGVEHYLSAHLWKMGTGMDAVFSVRGHEDLYMSRRNSLPVSKTARKKAWLVIVDAANAWLRQNPNFLIEAQATYVTNAIRTRNTKIADLQTQIATLEAEIAHLSDEAIHPPNR